MFNTVYVRVVLLALSLSLLNACSMNSGDYGPFTLVIESEEGKKVEDIIVTLTYGGSGGHSKYRSYRETQVASTGESIVFPRGYVTGTAGEAFGMYVGISHLDYQQISLQMVDINTEKKEQVIDLGKAMIRFNEISEKEISRRVKQGSLSRIEGRTIREPLTRDEAIIALKRSGIYMKVNSYFVKAIRIGRSDLVDKRLKLKLEDIYGIDVNSEQAQKFEKKLRDSIDYRMGYGN